MKKTLQKLAVSLLFGVLVTLITYLSWMSNAEILAQDHVYQKKHDVNPLIKIIAIDKKTTDVLGPEDSWSRSYYSGLINQLYHEDCRPSVLAFYLPLYKNMEHSGDQSLINACLNVGNVVVSSRMETNTFSLSAVPVQKLSTIFTGVTTAYGSLRLYARSGFSNLLLDTDGYVRYYIPDLVGSYGHVDSFAASVYQVYNHNTGSYRTGDHTNDRYLIDYAAGAGSYETFSFIDVYTGHVDASDLKDAIVLIGPTLENSSDVYNVPIKHGTQMYGVEIQANILQTMFRNEPISESNRTLCAITYGLLMTLFLFIVLDKSLIVGTLMYVFFMVLFFVVNQLMFSWGQIIPVIYFPFTLLISYIYFLFGKSSLERMQKTAEMKELLYSMAEAMTEAVDAKTPYNATHTRNVVRYCLELAEAVRQKNHKRRNEYYLSANDVDQLHMAALLHDVGKLDIPSKILDKSDRLGYRADALWEKWERIKLLYRVALAENRISREDYEQEIAYIDQARSCLETLVVKEFLADEDLEFINLLSAKEFTADPSIEPIPYLNADEKNALSIRRGTLTKEELDTTHFHVCYTEQILDVVKFGHGFDHVFDIARHHHEFLNGTGYPFGLKSESIDIPTRILTICDIFDALTADDRPYKKAKTREQTFDILSSMVENGELDAYLVTIAKDLWLK